MKLIIAQGNPGKKYAKTRHNLGFSILDELAKNYKLKWQTNSRFHAEIAKGTFGNTEVILVKPTTFYNETGLSARAFIDFYKLDAKQDCLLIHDDLALPFGVIRVRQKGSDGGNNGVKSINSHIGNDYWRIRIGINNDLRERIDDADFVLSYFNQDEANKVIESITPNVIGLIDEFCINSLSANSNKL